jgi:hypothetical protein
MTTAPAEDPLVCVLSASRWLVARRSDPRIVAALATGDSSTTMCEVDPRGRSERRRRWTVTILPRVFAWVCLIAYFSRLVLQLCRARFSVTERCTRVIQGAGYDLAIRVVQSIGSLSAAGFALCGAIMTADLIAPPRKTPRVSNDGDSTASSDPVLQPTQSLQTFHRARWIARYAVQFWIARPRLTISGLAFIFAQLLVGDTEQNLILVIVALSIAPFLDLATVLSTSDFVARVLAVAVIVNYITLWVEAKLISSSCDYLAGFSRHSLEATIGSRIVDALAIFYYIYLVFVVSVKARNPRIPLALTVRDYFQSSYWGVYKDQDDICVDFGELQNRAQQQPKSDDIAMVDITVNVGDGVEKGSRDKNDNDDDNGNSKNNNDDNDGNSSNDNDNDNSNNDNDDTAPPPPPPPAKFYIVRYSHFRLTIDPCDEKGSGYNVDRSNWDGYWIMSSRRWRSLDMVQFAFGISICLAYTVDLALNLYILAVGAEVSARCFDRPAGLQSARNLFSVIGLIVAGIYLAFSLVHWFLTVQRPVRALYDHTLFFMRRWPLLPISAVAFCFSAAFSPEIRFSTSPLASVLVLPGLAVTAITTRTVPGRGILRLLPPRLDIPIRAGAVGVAVASGGAYLHTVLVDPLLCGNGLQAIPRPATLFELAMVATATASGALWATIIFHCLTKKIQAPEYPITPFVPRPYIDYHIATEWHCPDTCDQDQDA